ncbi:DUF4440 domain-containing protein [Verrucomicrobia bacterium LW23]|nr:DUF4440 domain-containing protein [Verrucomicrobia bacterium LW23]
MLYPSAIEVTLAWMNFLNEGKADEVAKLYAEEAILIPTFSPLFLKTPEKRAAYFNTLGSKPNLRVELHQETLRVQKLTSTVWTSCGIYKFIFDVDEVPLTFEARFTFVLDLERESPIIQHHSSQIPRTLG